MQWTMSNDNRGLSLRNSWAKSSICKTFHRFFLNVFLTFFLYHGTNRDAKQIQEELHSDQLTAYERHFTISKLFEKLFATRAFHRTRLTLHHQPFWTDESEDETSKDPVHFTPDKTQRHVALMYVLVLSFAFLSVSDLHSWLDVYGMWCLDP